MLEVDDQVPQQRDKGQTMAEYAVVLSVVSISVVVTISLLSERVAFMLNDVISRI